jgi:putative hydrolase of the HAD superfamily
MSAAEHTRGLSQVRGVLFDLDDTLFDHRRSARAALTAVHAAFASEADFAAFERHHAHYLEEMHLEVLAGRATLEDARRERFRRVFAALGLTLDPADVYRVAETYRLGYSSARRAIEGAADLLARLRSSVAIAIVTNNLLGEQQDKLRVCGLTEYVDALVASEDVGTSKPDPEIFRIALARLGVRAEDAVMVGDSWANDIEGARAAGIRAVWCNRYGHERPSTPPGVAAIQQLTPVEAVVPVILAAD